MAIKIIKFDLPINGTKVTTLEALRDNLTDEIVKLARSGQLERWFKSRQLHELAKGVADAVASQTKDKALFLALCAVLEVEVHPDDASAIFDAPPKAGRHIKGGKYFELCEELKLLKEIHQKRTDILSVRILELESVISEIIEKDPIYYWERGVRRVGINPENLEKLENSLKKRIKEIENEVQITKIAAKEKINYFNKMLGDANNKHGLLDFINKKNNIK